MVAEMVTVVETEIVTVAATETAKAPKNPVPASEDLRAAPRGAGQGKGFLAGLGLAKPKAQRKNTKTTSRTKGQNGFAAKLDEFFTEKKESRQTHP